MARGRILVCDIPQAQRAMAECLPGRELSFVHNLAEAKVALAGGDYDMVVVGMHFDESQAFALLAHLRTRQRYGYVPVVCVRIMATVLPHEMFKAIEDAIKMLGAAAFLEIDGSNHLEVCRRLQEIADHPRV